ncbi:MAG: hypothetical protein AB1730_13325 [Myxococcota bacterium]|jgi:hypothetical protein
MHVRLVVLGFAVALVALSCGAERLEAPPAEQRADLMRCRGLDQLMPHFVQAISSGRTENLKHLVETQLLTPLREGDSPPINDVLRAIFRTLDAFARKPPEAGAQGADFCAPAGSPPPLEASNELCEMRRAMDVLVHQGKGIDAINLIEPQLETALAYITGEGNRCNGGARTPHYEIAALFSSMCQPTVSCQLSNGLDLVIAFTAYARTADGKALIAHLNELATKSSVLGLLNPSSLTESDTVALVRGLLPVIRNADAASLDAAFDLPFIPPEVRADLAPVIEDLKKVLARPDLMTPVKRALVCYEGKDQNLDLVRMVYRLALEEGCPEFGLTRLTSALKGVQDVDQRGSLIYLAGTLAGAVRSDETAIDSAAIVCSTLFSNAIVPGEARSNAQLALPVAADLVKNGVINEGICAVDTLLFGCAGGAQPACR